MAEYETDLELWLDVAIRDYDFFDNICSAKLRTDRTFLLQLAKKIPERCLGYLTGKVSLDFDPILASCAGQ